MRPVIKFLTLITLLCYVVVTLVLPRRINKQKSIPALSMLIFVTGLVSYGLQFELERGQFNVIAFTLCLGAIYIFHNHPKSRWLAYLFFTISVQLKLYPAIFVFALIEDWSDWKGNIKRIVGLGILNLAALFMFRIGSSYLQPLGALVNSRLIWPGGSTAFRSCRLACGFCRLAFCPTRLFSCGCKPIVGLFNSFCSLFLRLVS